MSDAINHSDTTCADAPDQQVRQQSILKNVVEHIHALVFSIDREYRYTCFNSSHAAMMKALYGAEIAVGGNLFSYMTVPDDARAARANLERTFQGEVLREEAFSGELTLSRRFFEITHRPLRCPAGEIIGAVMTATDITERRAMEQALRESEATLRAITDSTQAAILMMDQTGRVSFWNRAAEEILGWTAEEAIGQPVHTLICPERFHARHLAAYPAFLAGGAGATAGRTVEVRARRKDGGEIPVELSLSGVELESGWHAVGILLDITERNQIQTQLLAAQKMESIGQLAAGIAHEINTPTQFIGDNLSFLSNAFVSLRRVVEKYAEMEPVLAKHAPEQALAVAETRRQADLEYVLQEGALALTQATDGVQRVARIVRAMKDFSHPGTKEKCAVDLNAAILTTLTVARNAWKNVADIATDLAPDLPLVPCHVGEVNQVLLNLITNATHAIADTDAGRRGERGRISISTRQDGEVVELRLADTGCGIPEESRTRVFDPFFTTKEVGRGTGQGLAIAQRVIVTGHGGTITCQSEPGRGTTFVVRLPLALPSMTTNNEAHGCRDNATATVPIS